MKLYIYIICFIISFICNNSNAENAIANGYEYVDLGLPSGRLWATCNLGAKVPEEPGNYYAWGELYPKDKYTEKNYKWGVLWTLKKYKTDDENYSDCDWKNELDLEDDAAYVNIGESWRIPSINDWVELKNFCTWQKYSLNGISGYKVIGKNGVFIFLPAAGYGRETIENYGNSGWYQSRDLCDVDNDEARAIIFNTFRESIIVSHGSDACIWRTDGITIRPIYNKEIKASSISLNLNSATIPYGGIVELKASFIPDDTSNKNISWKSSNTNVATVQNGIVLAKGLGQTTIIASTLDGSNIVSNCNIKVEDVSMHGHNYINMGLASGTLWATCNIDAKSPKEYGKNIEVFDFSYIDEEWGDEWRVPNLKEFEELKKSCSWTWSQLDGVNGMYVIGPNSYGIFLPAAGWEEDKTHGGINTQGWYWTNTAYNSHGDQYYLFFQKDGTSIENEDDNYELSVRPVMSPICLVNNVSINKMHSMFVGEKYSFDVEILPSTATCKHLSWHSSNNNIAKIENGTVTAVSPGTVTITATTMDGSNLSSSCIITVEKKITASSISFDYTALNLKVGDTRTLSPIILPTNTTNKEVSWLTSNANVATVVNGIVKATGKGTATITASTTDGTNISATCQVAVDKRNQTISWEQNLNNIQYEGQMLELTATSSSGLKVKYKSNDENIATIFNLDDKVYLNPVNCGQTSIVAYQDGDDEYYSATETAKDIEVIKPFNNNSKTLIAYYSQSPAIDDIVVQLANQLTYMSSNAYTSRIEPINSRINEASTNIKVRDSVMNVINCNPNDIASYPEIKPLTIDVSEFDVIIMVYPLWNDMMVAPMQTFEKTHHKVLKNKEVGYIEYDETDNFSTSSNSKVLRICLPDIENSSEIINEWLNNNDPTGIKVIRSKEKIKARGIYDLQGRKLQKASGEGVYIINGLKTVIK